MVNSPPFVGHARRSESRFHNDLPSQKVLRFRGGGGLCDHLATHVWCPATIWASVCSLVAATVCDTFDKPLRKHRCNLLILRFGICRSEGSEYICLSKASVTFFATGSRVVETFRGVRFRYRYDKTANAASPLRFLP
jgi:hypothetical protein